MGKRRKKQFEESERFNQTTLGFYRELGDYFNSVPISLEDFEYSVRSSDLMKHPTYFPTKRDWSNFKGFVLEYYMNSVVRSFCRSGFLESTRFSNGNVVLEGIPLTYITTDTGSVYFGSNGYSFSEIDGLYEFHFDGRVIPIILEISFASKGSHVKERNRPTKLAREFYQTEPSMCYIKTRKTRPFGITKGKKGHPKNLTIWYPKKFHDLTYKLYMSFLQTFDKEYTIGLA